MRTPRGGAGMLLRLLPTAVQTAFFALQAFSLPTTGISPADGVDLVYTTIVWRLVTVSYYLFYSSRGGRTRGAVRGVYAGAVRGRAAPAPGYRRHVAGGCLLPCYPTWSRFHCT